MKVTVCKGCGQVMQARDQAGKPACTTCLGIHPDSGEEVEVEVDLNSSRCSYCGESGEKTLQSYKVLPFYDSRTHTHYCGCRGWD